MTQHTNTNTGQGQPGNTYYNRYARGGGGANLATRLFDLGPHIMAIVGFFVIVGSLIALENMDIVIGKITANYMFHGKYDWLMSLATTGLSIALIGTFFYAWRERWAWYIIVPLGLFALIPASIDVINDAMAVDILRFGHFINTSVQFAGDPTEAMMHNLYRILVGGISAVGEPIAAGSVIIFALMKEIFKGVFKP